MLIGKNNRRTKDSSLWINTEVVTKDEINFRSSFIDSLIEENKKESKNRGDFRKRNK